MQAARKCVRCNTLNEAGQLYCIKCGKYLSKEGKASRNPTIWDINADRDDGILAQNSVASKKQSDDLPRYVVICPQCKSAIAADNGVVPLACDQCGYFFQAGIDRIVPNQPQVKCTSDFSNSGNDIRKPASITMDNKVPKSIPKKSGPLASARRDESTLRLIVISKNGIPPEKVKESGDIIGANGTVLKTIKSQQQISIWHSPAGWYIRSLAGAPLYNGVPVNAGMQIKLSDGDMITIDKEQVRIEIV